MAGLAKARLISLTGKSPSQSQQQSGNPEAPEQGGFTVVFNPTTLKVTYANTLEGSNARGSKQRQYIGKQSTELAVELIFDTTDLTPHTTPPWGDDAAKAKAQSAQGEVDVRIFTARIVAMMDKADPNNDKSAPCRVQFAWGSFLFEGVMKSLTETLELFSVDGIPLRATLSLSLSEDNLEFKTAATGPQSPPVAVTNAGDTAARLAANNNLPPEAGKAIAAANGLDDLRSLPSGTALVMPAAGASVSAGVSLGASASASFGASASASASAGLAVSADDSGGFGGGSGLSITIGGGGNFGLDAGASASVGVGVSAGVGFGASVGGNASFGASFGASAGLNLAVSGGVAGAVAGVGAAAFALAGAGSVGGPSAGGAPGAQALMDRNGAMALAPAAPPRTLPPPSSIATSATATTRSAPPPPLPAAATPAAPVAALGTPARVAGATQVAGAIGLSSSPAGVVGLPPPLSSATAASARGHFQGITGVPMKAVRFGVATPPPSPLAYRRLAPDAGCLDSDGPCTTAAAATSSWTHRKAKGCGCGCGH